MRATLCPIRCECETHAARRRYYTLMTGKADSEEAAAEHRMEQRIIRVECLPDQAGIAAALRRAFAAGTRDEDDSEQMFEDLLKRLH